MIEVLKSGQAAPKRLICFAYAGGNAAMYLPWQTRLGASVEICAVQLSPRHGSGETHASFPALIRNIAQAIQPLLDRPYVLFGHSLGALVAFELSRFIKLMHLPAPARLIVSGCDAPQHKSDAKRVHDLPHDEFIAELRQKNGTPEAVLDSPELLALLLPAVRADFALVEAYQYRANIRLNVPTDVFAGQQDEVSAESLAPWLAETNASGKLHWFEGGHFFINSETDAVIDRIRQLL
ncbi:MAG: alpha/beta fold hydrolase [Rhodobacteraceae bacterium]|nr:alpha/beta fold hydrolase [Paracoccaceae bacterium]